MLEGSGVCSLSGQASILPSASWKFPLGLTPLGNHFLLAFHVIPRVGQLLRENSGIVENKRQKTALGPNLKAFLRRNDPAMKAEHLDVTAMWNRPIDAKQNCYVLPVFQCEIVWRREVEAKKNNFPVFCESHRLDDCVVCAKLLYLSKSVINNSFLSYRIISLTLAVNPKMKAGVKCILT